jgi:hypothetical protein
MRFTTGEQQAFLAHLPTVVTEVLFKRRNAKIVLCFFICKYSYTATLFILGDKNLCTVLLTLC